MTKVVHKDGISQEETEEVYGRKIPLERLLRNELDRQEEAGVLQAANLGNEYYSIANLNEINTELVSFGIDVSPYSPEELCKKSKSIHTRHNKQWSDHGQLISKGHYLHMWQSLYDHAVYLTDDEFHHLHPDSNIHSV